MVDGCWVNYQIEEGCEDYVKRIVEFGESCQVRKNKIVEGNIGNIGKDNCISLSYLKPLARPLSCLPPYIDTHPPPCLRFDTVQLLHPTTTI